MNALEDRIKNQAHLLGFELVGIAPATQADGFDRLRDWLDRGFAGTMEYMHRHGEARRHPVAILLQVRSVVMVAMNYHPPEEQEPCSPHCSNLTTQRFQGRISSYARGRDYHDLVRERLNRLLAWLGEEQSDVQGRAVVDTAPLLERDFARRAGLGWFGKNSMLLNKRIGSYFFLGALLTNLELSPDPPHTASHCGSCTACLDACPTQAFVEPGLLDARRCISYLTIEHRGDVPVELRSGLGDWIFGCDVCQEVCPWNRKVCSGREPDLEGNGDLKYLDLLEVLGISEEEFRRRFRGTALMRTQRRGLLRNAALILGNNADASALPALRRVLDDHEPIIREAARWAIANIQCRCANQNRVSLSIS
jgi:epoxyqueuosine reductase